MIVQAIPQLLSAGMQVIPQLISGIVSMLPQLAASAATLIAEIVSGIVSNLPQILEQGIALLGELLAGILQAIPEVIAFVPQLFDELVSAFSSIDWASLGVDLINGIIDGISSAASSLFSSLRDLASSALSAAKNALGIRSPSKLFRDEIGQWIPPGISVGIEDSVPDLNKTMRGIIDVSSLNYGELASLPVPQAADERGSGIDLGMGYAQEERQIQIILNINGREFARAIYEDLNAVTNDHGVSLIMA